jgi:dihydrofolate reductase
MSRTIYYTATTLDGFIATPDDSLDWLLTRQTEPEGPMSYQRFIPGIGAMAMGATSYEWILGHEFSGKPMSEWVWPYDIPCWVFTHRELPVIPGSGVVLTRDDVGAVHSAMVAAAGERDVWMVGGGRLAAQFAERGLIDEVIASIAPVTLGDGARILPAHVELQLEEIARNGDFACARYTVLR